MVRIERGVEHDHRTRKLLDYNRRITKLADSMYQYGQKCASPLYTNIHKGGGQSFKVPILTPAENGEKIVATYLVKSNVFSVSRNGEGYLNHLKKIAASLESEVGSEIIIRLPKKRK